MSTTMATSSKISETADVALMLFVKKPTPPMIIKIKMLNRVGIICSQSACLAVSRVTEPCGVKIQTRIGKRMGAKMTEI